MIDALLAEIRELDAKATKNWFPVSHADFGGDFYAILGDSAKNALGGVGVSTEQAANNSAFIARARALLPLCAKIIGIYEKYARANGRSPHMQSELAAAMREGEAL